MATHVENRSGPEGAQTLATLGLRDHPHYPLGLTDAPIVSVKAHNPATGNPVHLTLVDYPIHGLGVEYLLRGIAPGAKRYASLSRFGTIGDWVIPDEIDGNDVKRGWHERHMQFAPYAEFHRSHRQPWMEQLAETAYDPLFKSVWETRFVKPEAFARAQYAELREEYAAWKVKNEHKPSAEQERSPAYKVIDPLQNTEVWMPLEAFMLGSLRADLRGEQSGISPRKRALKLLLETPSDEPAAIRLAEYGNELFEVYLDHMHQAPIDLQMRTLVNSYNIGSHIVCMDPETGDSWTGARSYFEEATPAIESANVDLQIEGMSAHFITAQGSARLDLGEVQENGEYAISRSVFTYPDAYRQNALLPLIAWEETPEGRRFLTQCEAMDVLPEGLRDERWDVQMGTMVVAHGTPEVTKRFPKSMAIPGDPTLNAEGKKPVNDIAAAQVPVLVYAPVFASELLKRLPQ